MFMFLIINGVFACSLIQGKVWENPKNCGATISRRIIGGRLSAAGKYPWLVRLGYETNIPSKHSFLCGGTLINEKFVITAAHCVDYAKKVKVIHVGETEITCPRSPCKDERVQEIKVEKIIKHEKFNNSNGFADIALLKLEKPVKITKFATPICLSNEEFEKVGETCTVAGWGMENYITRERPGGLKELKLNIIDRSLCKKDFPLLSFTSKNFICGGGINGEDTCGGDSGGPLMKIKKINNTSPRMYLLGVISFGSTKCGVGIPAVFTSISFYMDWIIKQVL